MPQIMKGRSFYDKPWYNSYRCMMSRCYRPKDASYKYYGGRGITVCDEWHSIVNFENWVNSHPYFDGATLDRIDCNGNYTPDNCRWATMFEQDKNRRNSILIEWNGERHNITEWSIITGINRSTLNNRYHKFGYRGEKLFEKTRKYKGATWTMEGGKRKWVTG